MKIAKEPLFLETPIGDEENGNFSDFIEGQGPCASCRRRAARLVLRCARVSRPVGAGGIDVERPRRALDDLFRDHDLLHAFEARQIEHGIEQDTFHDRAQSARACLAVDRLAGNGALDNRLGMFDERPQNTLFRQRFRNEGESIVNRCNLVL